MVVTQTVDVTSLNDPVPRGSTTMTRQEEPAQAGDKQWLLHKQWLPQAQVIPRQVVVMLRHFKKSPKRRRTMTTLVQDVVLDVKEANFGLD